jgi:hypothetical protein
MRDLYVEELKTRYGEQCEQIDWEASGRELSGMLSERMGTRCKVAFDKQELEYGVISPRIDTREFGCDPASPAVQEVFDSMDWIRFTE